MNKYSNIVNIYSYASMLEGKFMGIQLSPAVKKITAYMVAGLGAIGSALQNYIAVDLFLRGIVGGVMSISKWMSGFIHAAAIGAGGLCSGMVNYFINLELLEGFLERLTSDKAGVELTGWRQFSYYAGIFVFAVTGVLFGMTAFTFSATGPLAFWGLAAGVFVAVIMTIQEIETWLQGFDEPESDDKASLYDLFMQWKSTLTWGKLCGHLIAAGNVLGLSLLFTLGLAEVLMVLQVAAFPAFVIGLAIAFTFGAFTEFYFYNFFLAKFCDQIESKWEAMKASQYASLGFLCIGVNAFVNAALTYSGVGLLAGALVMAGIALPPVGVIMTLSGISAIFAGAASAILGADFWIRHMGVQDEKVTTESPEHHHTGGDTQTVLEVPSGSTYKLSIFQTVTPEVTPPRSLDLLNAA